MPSRVVISHDGLSYRIADPGGLVSVGRLTTCKCGRRLWVETMSMQPRDTPVLAGLCLECLVVTDGFREAVPEVARLIEGWKRGG